MNRSCGIVGDRWSNYDKYSTTTKSLSRPSSKLRSKSPMMYRSNSSLSRSSSTSNLKIDDDYFNALNKSLGAHDTSFLEEDVDDSGSLNGGGGHGGDNYRYNSLQRPSSASARRNRYQSGGDGGATTDSKYRYGQGKTYGSYDNDLNNNNNYPTSTGYSTTSRVIKGHKGVSYDDSDSEPELEPYSSYKYSSSLKTIPTSTTKTKNKGLFDDDYGNNDDISDGGNESDESMNEYLNCKSFYPDNLSQSKLFHGIRSSSTLSNNSEHRLLLNNNNNHHHDSSFDTSQQQPDDNIINFQPKIKIRDQQAIRTGEFHPNGHYYAIGSNSKLLRIFHYKPSADNVQSATNEDHSIPNDQLIEPVELFARYNYHKGSIYCLTWNKLGNLLATGSNDKMVKILPFNQNTDDLLSPVTNEININTHDGTVRDLCFMDDLTNGSSLLLSGGSGDCKVYITDCETGQTFLSLSGHSGPILSLYTWGGAMFVSGSQDRTIRFWDLRTNSCINFVTCPTISRQKPGGAVAAVCVDPSGKLLVSGHEDSTCMLYDIRGGRVIQTFHPHHSDIRTIRFSNQAYYLLTGGYDNRIVLTDLQGDLTQPLQSIQVANHDDKVIQCRWHPNEFSFITTSADRSAIIWTLPDYYEDNTKE